MIRTAMAAYVQRAAALCGATVGLVHVCDLASHSGFELYARPGNEIAEDHWNVASEKLDYFLISEFPPATSARILLAGDAASVIAETAKKSEFDLIVMPTHAGRFRRMLLGSTAAKVLDGAECPVLTTQHAETVAPRSLEHRRWVCAVDLSSDSLRVLRSAKSAVSRSERRHWPRSGQISEAIFSRFFLSNNFVFVENSDNRRPFFVAHEPSARSDSRRMVARGDSRPSRIRTMLATANDYRS